MGGVRTPEGTIKTEVAEAPEWAKRWAKVPLARGVATLAESMALGIQALTWSANKQVAPNERLSKGAMGGTLAFAIVVFSAVFIVLPALAARGLGGLLAGGFAFNLFEGTLRLAMFLGYIALIRWDRTSGACSSLFSGTPRTPGPAPSTRRSPPTSATWR
ncbi:MAG TPA: DUF1385 domain-containing protein [Acidimicrobiia bacterium]|nr:DUF1385 domain-containing protein [Acidimicrobiia bacterium]